jgi:DNA invertase Pin-like site-specific DNA recombinase
MVPHQSAGYNNNVPTPALLGSRVDTTTPAGKAMFQMMGVFAEFERSMIPERVRAGLKRAKDEGKVLGRPPIAPEIEQRVRDAPRARSLCARSR